MRTPVFTPAQTLGLCLLLIGCSGADGVKPAAPSIAAPPEAAAEPPGESSGEPVAPPAIAWGRYKGRNTCLELFANGDAHLNAVGNGPKVQAIGAFRMALSDEAGVTETQFEVRRIWRARWVSACRKDHELGSFIDSALMLGHEFKPGTHDLRIRQLDDGGVELCAKSCENLEREPTVLQGHWRAPKLGGREPTLAAPEGQVLQLQLREGNMSGLWLSLGPARQWASLSGSAEVVAREGQPDHYTVSLTATMVDTGSGVTAEPDSEWNKGSRVELRVERLAHERLRACRVGAEGEASACAVLERSFDAYDYDVH